MKTATGCNIHSEVENEDMKKGFDLAETFFFLLGPICM